MRSEEILRRINALPAQRVKLMEVCGTHTMSIARAGIKRLLFFYCLRKRRPRSGWVTKR